MMHKLLEIIFSLPYSVDAFGENAKRNIFSPFAIPSLIFKKVKIWGTNERFAHMGDAQS